MENDARPAPHPWLVPGLVAGTLILSFLGLGSANRARESADRALEEAKAASKAAQAARAASEKAVADFADIRGDLELLATTVGALERNVKTLSDRIDFGPGGGNPFAAGAQGPDGPSPYPVQAFLEFTPELRESLRKAVAAKGVRLLEDRVEVPGRIVLRGGPLEYFAVFPGGKAHESVVVLTGESAEEGARVEGLGAALNSCLMALGLRPGTPIRFLPGRTLPAKGSPVHLSVEWEEDGRTVRVRAEDMVWDRERGRTMDEGKFIYVGAFFDTDGYLPDLVGDAVAVYSVPTCVVDLDDARAANDMVFEACGPRIPPEGTKVRVVFSPKPLEPTRTWDPAEPAKRTDGGAPAAPAPGGGDGR